MIIRQITKEDAEQFLNLCITIDQESEFMLLEPGERNPSVKVQQDLIDTLLKSSNQTIFVAEVNNQLVGYIAGYGGRFKRTYNNIYVVIGILQNYTGQRLGVKLFENLISWANSNNSRRLELSVMVHNERAIKLYEKMGFQIEALRKDCMFVNGKYVDEYSMVKFLPI